MAKSDNTYQNTKVGYKSDGFFMDDDGNFDFFGTGTLTGQQMRSLLYPKAQFSVIANSAGVLSAFNLPSAGYIIFSIADAASNASAWLTSAPSPGQTMILLMRGLGSTGSVYISLSGVSLVGKITVNLSSISIQNSVGSSGWVELLCTAAGEWSILRYSPAGVVQRGSA